MPISNPSTIGKEKKKTSLVSQSELGSIFVGTLEDGIDIAYFS